MAHTASAAPIPDMPPRQEAFCRSVAQGASAAAAARAAGYSVDNARGQATRLLARPYVRRRIEELRDGLLEARNREVAELVAIARETLDKAREEGKLGAMLRAIELIARLNGLFARQLPEIAHAALQPADGLLDAEEAKEDEDYSDDEGGDGGEDDGGGGEAIRFLSEEPNDRGWYAEDEPVMDALVASHRGVPEVPVLPAPPRYADGEVWDGLGRHPCEDDPAFPWLEPWLQRGILSAERTVAHERAVVRRTGYQRLIEPITPDTYRTPAPGSRRGELRL
ncbi:terminase small subunit [Inquilinus sp. CAU 1745]|uniref:terminase small subunit n=1 Tax=Inquilinus sp. CAU 1745 TaxID=3140369 RepID=UPI00325BB3C7